MRQIIIIFILIISVLKINAQDYISAIKNSYRDLDTSSYVMKVINEIQNYIIDDNFIKFKNKPNKNNSDYEIIDIIEHKLNKVIKDIDNSNLIFILNFEIDTAKIKTNNYFVVNPNNFKFNVYCVGKKAYPYRYILFYNDKLDNYSSFPTFSKKYYSQIRNAYKVVLRKKPQYLLNCWALPNSIVYVLNDKIYVYRVIQRKVYELDEYVRLFKQTIRS